ncbi:MAG: hypothetical protein IKN33_05070 [Selenomonadaceae bacterium]|nr:hypothetical protein [Selenomonadaceae bacterium]MBR6906292.1 hypothetical protein [Selenomonadaceae bacterium]
MIVNGIDVTVTGVPDISEHEIENYIAYVHENTQEPLSSLHISAAENGQVELGYELRTQKFERIRRITGYLVGTTDRWNNAKRVEEHDRVKHGLQH